MSWFVGVVLLVSTTELERRNSRKTWPRGRASQNKYYVFLNVHRWPVDRSIYSIPNFVETPVRSTDVKQQVASESTAGDTLRQKKAGDQQWSNCSTNSSFHAFLSRQNRMETNKLKHIAAIQASCGTYYVDSGRWYGWYVQ